MKIKIIKKNKYDYFLNELTRLSQETGLIIGGCGCCNSPFISEIDKKKLQNCHYILNKTTEPDIPEIEFLEK